MKFPIELFNQNLTHFDLIIDNQIDTEKDFKTEMESLKKKMTIFIENLLLNDYPKLLNLLYRVDVKEIHLSEAMELKNLHLIAQYLSNAIIDRIMEKINMKNTRF